MRLLNGSFSPEEVTLMKTVLDAAAARLRPAKCTAFEMVVLAEGILLSAAAGERDPGRLLAAALTTVGDDYVTDRHLLRSSTSEVVTEPARICRVDQSQRGTIVEH
jgi:hypothetical protein